jgi:hypothetical protein
MVVLFSRSALKGWFGIWFAFQESRRDGNYIVNLTDKGGHRMKTIIGGALLVLFVLFMGRTEISFSPFYIRMLGWQNVVGWLRLLIGIGFLCNDARQQSYEKGLVDGADYVKVQIKNYLTGKEETK